MSDSNGNDNKEEAGLDWKDNSIDWKEMIKKEARGYDKGEDLGEVQEIGLEFVVTQRGRISKHKFYLPKNLAKGYDGKTLWFSITEEDAEDKFKKDRPPKEGEYSRYTSSFVTEQYLPLIEKHDRIIESSRGGSATSESGIEDWESIVHKGVRSKDMQAIGSVTAVTENNVVITSDGARSEYNVPKEEVETFNGAEVILNVPIDRLDQFKVKVSR